MLRLQALLLALVFVGITTSSLQNSQAVPVAVENENLQENPQQISDRSSRLDHSQETRNRFAAYFDELIDELIAFKITLIEARERLLFYALGQHQAYLEFVSFGEQGATLREQITRNVLRGLQHSTALSDQGPEGRHIMAHYHQEFDAYLKSLPTSNRSMTP